MSGTKWKLTVGHMIGFLILAALVLSHGLGFRVRVVPPGRAPQVFARRANSGPGLFFRAHPERRKQPLEITTMTLRALRRG